MLSAKNSQKQRGFSLIETIVVLAIISLVVSGTWLAYGVARSRQQARSTVEGLLVLSSNLRKAYGLSPKDGQNITQLSVDAKWTPATWTFDNNLAEVITPVGPAYILFAGNSTWEHDFEISFDGMTETQCNAMIIALKGVIASNPKNFVEVRTTVDAWYQRTTGGFSNNVPACVTSYMKGYAPGMSIYMNF